MKSYTSASIFVQDQTDEPVRYTVGQHHFWITFAPEATVFIRNDENGREVLRTLRDQIGAWLAEPLPAAETSQRGAGSVNITVVQAEAGMMNDLQDGPYPAAIAVENRMAKKFTFMSAHVRKSAISFAGKDGSKTVRIDFTMAWTEKVRSAMGWADLSDDQSEVGLKGSMNVLEMTMEVAEKTFDFGSGVLKDFTAVRVGDDKKSSIELRAQHVTHERTVAAKVESYGENASRAKGSLRISYEWVKEDDNRGEDDDAQQELIEE